MKEKVNFDVSGREVSFYPAKEKDAPLIVLNNYSGDGGSVVKAMDEIGCGDCNLISVGKLKWDHDMTPWYCPPLSKEDTPCTGGADEYLSILLNEIVPETLSRVEGEPRFTGIAGYSLAGLFALYAMYHTDRFSRIASISGSLWFPDFKEYAQAHEMKKMPDRLYLSLGDKEARTGNAVLKTVQENTEFLAGYYKEKEIRTEFELNAGNHFKDAALRSAKGIAAILR